MITTTTTTRSRALRLLPLLALWLLLAPACSDDPAPAADAGPPADGAPQTDAADDATAGSDAKSGPLARVYKVSPTEDNKQTTEVTLRHITDASGKLTGKWVEVWNCLPEEGGQKLSIELSGMSLTGSLCVMKQSALPDKNGTYLQYAPPKSDTAGNDAFAELMMYHHVTTYHDHLAQTLGMSHLAKAGPLKAIVNLQGKADLFGGWVGLPNAAFIPKSSGDLLKQYGVDILAGRDGIVFGYNNIMPTLPEVNFAYDASVIYHEYTHYSVGEALWLPALDKYGVDPTPKGLNEALADYFPSSYTGKSKLGTYALGKSARDLAGSYACPGHIVGEEHVDGQVASAALWAARAVLGASVADRAFANAMVTFTARTNFELAATAFLAEVKKLSPDKEAQVRKIFTDSGLLGCVRLRKHQDLASAGSYGPGFAGTAMVPNVFSGGVPGYLQYSYEIPAGTKELTIEYAGSSGSLMGMGGAKADLSIALRKGGSPITYDYSSGKAVQNAMKVLKGQDDGKGGFKLVLSGDCVSAGTLVYQFMHHGASSGSVSRVKISASPTKTNTSDNFDVCPK